MLPDYSKNLLDRCQAVFRSARVSLPCAKQWVQCACVGHHGGSAYIAGVFGRLRTRPHQRHRVGHHNATLLDAARLYIL